MSNGYNALGHNKSNIGYQLVQSFVRKMLKFEKLTDADIYRWKQSDDETSHEHFLIKER